MAQFLWVCLGGAAGSGARYLLSAWLRESVQTAFPLGTLVVNLLGSFAIAVVMAIGLGDARPGATALWTPNQLTPVQLALTSGVLGGFTTFSAFSWETLRLVQNGATGTATAYVAASLVGCLTACALGWVSGRWLFA